MVQLIVGEKGKGKTKRLLEKVNEEVKNTSGTICYLDKSKKHMYELNNRVRLINVPEYMVSNADEFVGFILGIVSQDNDLDQMYFDSFLKIACLEGQNITPTVDKLIKLGEKFNVQFILSVSQNEEEIPSELKSKIIMSL